MKNLILFAQEILEQSGTEKMLEIVAQLSSDEVLKIMGG